MVYSSLSVDNSCHNIGHVSAEFTEPAPSCLRCLLRPGVQTGNIPGDARFTIKIIDSCDLSNNCVCHFLHRIGFSRIEQVENPTRRRLVFSYHLQCPYYTEAM